METLDINKIKEIYAERRKRSRFELRPFEEKVLAVMKKQGRSEIECIDWINEQVECQERFLHAMPSDLPEKIRTWIDSPDRRGMYMFGEVGTGKTYILYALAKLFRANGKVTKMYNFPNWLDQLRQSFDKENSDINLAEQLSHKCVMMIDDIGSEKASEWTLEIMYRLINNRYEQALPTIFAGNLGIDQFSDKYGDRIASRVTEMVGQKNGIIKISGEDRRLKI